MAGEGNSLELARFLPAIYHRYAEEAENPLGALLVIAEEIFSGFDENIKELNKYFDAYTTPVGANKDFLTWLASWVVLELDNSSSEEKKRFLIRNAAKLYRLRGTFPGLKYASELYFGIDVEIKEWAWKAGMVIGLNSEIGLDTHLMEKQTAHCFTVTCHFPRPIPDKSVAIRKIRKLLDLVKPAHTKYYLEITFPKA